MTRSRRNPTLLATSTQPAFYLLDTDMCIYWLNGRQSVRDKLLAAGLEQIAISVITQAELFFGALKAQHRQSGQSLPAFDLLIASIALVENRYLVTNNTRH